MPVVEHDAECAYKDLHMPCSSVLFPMTSSDLAKYSVTRKHRATSPRQLRLLQWRRNEFESGGHMSGAGNFFYRPPPTFLKCPLSGGAQCTVRSLVHAFTVLCLKLVYSWSRCNILTRLLCDNNLVMTDIERLMNVSTYFSDSGNRS